jgi:Cdc6-like AAA superfamily ATPase
MKEINNERVDLVLKNRWINYPKANQVLKALEMLLRFPESDRMQNLLIMGESNNGKTTIARRFFNLHQPYIATVNEPDTDYPIEIVIRPVIMVQCPHIPHEKSLYYSILDQMNLPYLKTTKSEYLKQTVVNALKDMKVQILILDEIHHILSGSAAKQREFLNLIKYISNEAFVSIVALGTNEASFALKAEKQLDTRFDKIIIPKWKYDDDFLRLLATVEKILPLEKESGLTDEKLAKDIYQMSHGILGEVIKILKLAAISSIETGEEKITRKVLSDLNYISPFDHSNMSIY